MFTDSYNEDFLGKGAKGRRQEKRKMRMRRREARTKMLEQKAQGNELDNKAKDVQVGLTATLAQETTAPTPAAGGTPATAAAGTPAGGTPAAAADTMLGMPKKTVMIGGGAVALLLIGLVVFFLVKK